MKTNFHQLWAFGEVLRAGSFSRAARQAGVSQSVLSQHIANLERSIGGQLLIRMRKGVELTSTGRDFVELADHVRKLDAQLSEKIQRYRDLEAGHLRVIANAPQPGLRVIEAFNSIHPDVQVEFTLYDWTRAMFLLQNGEVDVGFVTAPDLSDQLYAREIERARYVLYCRNDHPFARRKSVSLLDVSDSVLLLPETGSLTERVVRAAFQSIDARMQRVVKTATFPVMKEAILQALASAYFWSAAPAKSHA